MAKAGRLDTKIVIEQQIESRNDAGEVLYAWTLFATLWAEEVDPKGREFFSSDTRIAEVGRIFNVRYIAGIEPTFRVVEGGVNYDIKAINPIGRNNMLEIVCASIGR